MPKPSSTESCDAAAVFCAFGTCDPFSRRSARSEASGGQANPLNGASRSTLGKRQQRGEPFNRNAEPRRVETCRTYRGRGVG